MKNAICVNVLESLSDFLDDLLALLRTEVVFLDEGGQSAIFAVIEHNSELFLAFVEKELMDLDDVGMF